MKVALVFCLLASPVLAEGPPAAGRVAFFGIHFIDLSTEGAINGVRADETARTGMAAALVAEDMVARGFVLVPLDPVAKRLETVSNPARCNGCDTAMAQELGADYALTGEVSKVSNLILSLQLNLREAETGKTLRAGTVDIRGNTDESWQRGFRYLLRNLIFRK
ncbi:DUF3280 domain-containing protein [Tabrizicola soli]|uniref:DUF3280 domain-containing protein n=1 Tax=Tabrizicola soli TaxID=2185115 RepID=A0ABV7DRS6_9RHOB|nr:DUF3280 domain-containing protein [Tabrizicola soli]